MSRITGFVSIELGECINSVSRMLTVHEDRIHRLLRTRQADEDDKKACDDALARIQRIRNGLHG